MTWKLFLFSGIRRLSVNQIYLWAKSQLKPYRVLKKSLNIFSASGLKFSAYSKMFQWGSAALLNAATLRYLLKKNSVQIVHE